MNAETLELMLRTELPAAAGGDRSAYGRIVVACQNTVTAIALAITRDVASSEDIAQEAFLKAWQQLNQLKSASSFLPWLRQITRNLARDHLRANRNRPLSGEGADVAIQMAADPSPTPSERLLQTEEEIVATEIISALPEESRETLLLYYREGQSSQQVATLLGLSDAAVRKRLSRARASVREEMLKRFGDFARSSAPSAAFAALVASALSVASPPAAAASILGVGATVGVKTLGKIVLGSMGGIALGLGAAFAGVYLGLKRNLRGALDAEERRGLIRSAGISGLATVGFMAGIVLAARYSTTWMPSALLTAVFFSVVFWQSMVVEPRIKARRHALEAARDPERAARCRRRERLLGWLACAVGFGLGGAGLIAGLISSGRL
ncbi:MAG: sigma-70 family RNA polymerase sigma factor [Pseudoxanthomonas sp.]